MLTPIGVDIAAPHSPAAINYNCDASKINHTNIRHDLSVQLYFLTVIAKTPVRYYKTVLNFKGNETALLKMPDLIYATEDGVIAAVELERTQKNKKRILHTFGLHTEALHRGHYHKVTYVFPSQSMCSTYQSLYAQDKWPLYNDSGECIADKFIFPKQNASLYACFSFQVSKML